MRVLKTGPVKLKNKYKNILKYKSSIMCPIWFLLYNVASHKPLECLKLFLGRVPPPSQEKYPPKMPILPYIKCP